MANWAEEEPDGQGQPFPQAFADFAEEPEDQFLVSPGPTSQVTPNYDTSLNPSGGTDPSPMTTDEPGWDQQPQESPLPPAAVQEWPAPSHVNMERRAAVQASQLAETKKVLLEREISPLENDAIDAIKNNTDRRSYESGTVPQGILEKILAVRFYFNAKFKEALSPADKNALLIIYLEFEFRLASQLFAHSTNRDAIALHYSRSILNSAWNDSTLQPLRRYKTTADATAFLRAVRDKQQ